MTPEDKPVLPNVRYGDKDSSEVVDWKDADIGPDDDEELAETPKDVVDMLGFDPLHVEDDEEEEHKSKDWNDRFEQESKDGGEA